MTTWWVHTRVMLAREFGWTLEYVDGLSIDDINCVMAVLDAEARRRE